MNSRFGLARATPELAVFASALSAILWGAILILPGDSLAHAELHNMQMFGGDITWSIVFFIIAGLQLWRLEGRGALRRTKWALLIDVLVTFATAMAWTFITALCLTGEYPPSPYAGSTATLALGLWWDFSTYEITMLFKHSNSRDDDIRKAA